MTVKECHQLIRELYDTIDELRSRVAHLERELYGVKRERFIADDEQADSAGRRQWKAAKSTWSPRETRSVEAALDPMRCGEGPGRMGGGVLGKPKVRILLTLRVS